MYRRMLGHIYLFIYLLLKLCKNRPRLYASVFGIYADTPYRSIGVAVSAYRPRRYIAASTLVGGLPPYQVES